MISVMDGLLVEKGQKILLEKIWSISSMEEMEGWIYGIETTSRHVSDYEAKVLERRIDALRGVGGRDAAYSGTLARLRAHIASQQGSQGASDVSG